MHIYYSAPFDHTEYLLDFDIKYLLCSIHNMNVEKQLEKNSWMLDGTRYFMIDNGAFSAWNKDKDIITVDDYSKWCINFYNKFKNKFKDIFFIGLDNIPGKRGTNPTQKQIDYSCELTFNNYQTMLKHGVKNVVPVIHQFENVWWVKEYEKYTDYICLSPANDQSNKSRALWLDDVYKIINPNTKTHGLAVTGKILLERYPWFTVDSISWKQPFLFGQVFYWDFYNLIKCSAKKFNFNKKKNIKEIECFSCLLNKDLTNNEKAKIYSIFHLESYKKLELYITQLWEERGVIWE